MRPATRLVSCQPKTTFSRVTLAEIGDVQRTVVALHGEGLTPLTRISYLTPSGAPIREATIYVFAEWSAQVLDAIARVRRAEKVDLCLGTAPPLRVWSATESGELGLAFRLQRRSPAARSAAPPPAPLPPTVALCGDELLALERALRAVQSLSTSPPTPKPAA